MDSTYLAHHGVKGQKWGVRKERPQNQYGQNRSYNDTYSKAQQHYQDTVDKYGDPEDASEKVKSRRKAWAIAGSAAVAAIIGISGYKVMKTIKKPKTGTTEAAKKVASSVKNAKVKAKKFTGNKKFTVKSKYTSSVFSRMVHHSGLECLGIYLCHYGVKGQKWGVRKDAVKGFFSKMFRKKSTLDQIADMNVVSTRQRDKAVSALSDIFKTVSPTRSHANDNVKQISDAWDNVANPMRNAFATKALNAKSRDEFDSIVNAANRASKKLHTKFNKRYLG